jgi:DNA polymerase-3 subunit beta
MKISGKAGTLAAAARIAASATNGKAIPILGALLIDATDKLATFTGTNLNTAMTAACAGAIEEPGRAAVPAKALDELLVGIAADSDVTIGTIDSGVQIKAGRSRYRLPVLPAGDFPPPPNAPTAAELVLSRDQVRCLFGSTAFAISTEEARYYLRGVYLHVLNRGLCAAATNGYTLARAISDIAPILGSLPEPGVIIPKTVVDQIIKFKADEIRLRIDARTIVAYADHVTLAAKLIDATFPDYVRVIPAAAKATAEVERVALVAALERMAAVGTKERTTLTLGWNGHDGARLTMGGGQIAEDIFDAETSGEATIGLAISRFQNLVEAIDAEQLQLGIVSTAEPMLVTPIGNGDLMTLLMPCWDSAP